MKGKPKVAFVLVLLIVNMMMVTSTIIGHSQEKKYFFTLEITVSAVASGETVKACELLKYETEKIGIDLEIKTYDKAVYLGKILSGKLSSEEGGYDIIPGTCTGWNDGGALRAFYHSSALCPKGLNHVLYSNGVVDALFDDGAEETNFTRRKGIYGELVEILTDDMATLPLHYFKSFIVRQKSITDFVNEPYRELLRYAGRWRLAGKTATDDTSVTYAMMWEPEQLSSFYALDSGSVVSLNLVSEPLVQYNRGTKSYEGVLAESWETSEDGLTWTFHLRDDAYWHDGVKFTAEDVKFTYEAIANPDVGCAFKSYTAPIDSIEVVDNYTVAFHLKQRYAPIMAEAFIIEGRGGIMPKHIFDGVNVTDYKKHWSNTERMIGTGAYKFVKWVKGEYVEFEKNTQWWGGESFIDHFYTKMIPDKTAAIAALKTGEVNILDYGYSYSNEDIADLEANTNLEVTSQFNTGYGEIKANCKHPILQNKWVRWALSYSFPREHYCNDIVGLQSVPASQLTSPVSWWYNENLTVLEYNLTKAKECMELAGYDYALLEAAPGPDAMTLYGIPAVAVVAGIAIGTVPTYLIKRRRKTT